MTEHDAFQNLLNIMDRLLGPEGCPWDREQTMLSIRSSVVEEACELKEAIEIGDNAHICEEIGDLFLNAVFLSKLAEKERRFSMKDALSALSEKLIRRHPHVFGDTEIEDSDAVKRQWETIKQNEKGKEHRKSILDSVPAGLHVVSRAQKVLKKISRTTYALPIAKENLHTEDELADKLLSLIHEAQSKNFDLELALRRKLTALEDAFRKSEN